LARVLEQAEAAQSRGEEVADPWSPWHGRDGWRLNGDSYQDMRWRDGAAERLARIHYGRGGYRLEIENRIVAGSAEWETDGRLAFSLDSARERAAVLRQDGGVIVILDGHEHLLHYIDPLVPTVVIDETGGRLTAPMPGKVIEVKTAAGAHVKRGQALLVLEAMKMEHTIVAPADGVVERVHFAAGELVEEGAALIAFVVEETEATDAPAR
jgi:3-methylcrotonyl-CoA carboxylase alpha subunit